jgi:hypothetical protein
MECNNFVASMLAGCFLALVFSDGLLSQDAEAPTRQGFDLMSEGRPNERHGSIQPGFPVSEPRTASGSEAAPLVCVGIDQANAACATIS